MKGKARSG